MNMKRLSDEMDNLCSIAEGIAQQWGENCEVVIHDWSKGYDKSIVAIYNGHVTGRKIGDCGSNLGLEVLRGTVQDGNRHNYITQTKDGKSLRSTTIYIKNDEGSAIGALCINYDITALIATTLQLQDLSLAKPDSHSEYFATNIGDLLQYLLLESVEVVGKPVAQMTKNDKLKAFAFLDRRGAFLISKSGEKVCQFFDVSKFTLYKYLDTVREGKNENADAGPNGQMSPGDFT